MKRTLVLLSDTHGRHRELTIPDGHILVHAGDFTRYGRLEELDEFNAFLRDLPHCYKVVIAGNHDFCFQHLLQASRTRLNAALYLQDEGVELLGLHFYGSPWQPWFCDWAFNVPRGPALRAKWDQIPPQTTVLVTHSPPLGYGDRTVDQEQVGCADLLVAVQRVRPRLHVFGHIHEAAGQWQTPHTAFVNASSCNLAYQPVNPPVVWEVETPTE